jgi:dTDP-4-amino-4,6-dideoxygalactose transaminase
VKVPFFDLRRLYLEQKQEIDSAIRHVLDSGSYILGQSCQTFEEHLKKYLSKEGSGEVIACNSGTDALILSLLASGIQVGDEVLTVSHTAVPTVSAIRSVGAVPVFIDIDADTWLMDLKKLEMGIAPQTKAIVAVHLYGNVVPIPSIQEILKKKGREDIVVIEDAAQAQGASFQSQQVGTMERFGAFSFYPTKNLGALGDGGAIFSRSEEDASLLRMLRNYGKKDHYTAHVARGVNSRLDEIQAAILTVRLNKVSEWNLRKFEMIKAFRREFEELPIRFQEQAFGSQAAWHLCVIALESEVIRDKLMKYLETHGIQTLIHYPIPTHLQTAFVSKKSTSLPITEKLSKTILTLPMNAGLKNEEQDHVIETVQSFFQ